MDRINQFEPPPYGGTCLNVSTATPKLSQMHFTALTPLLYQGDFLEGKVRIEPQKDVLSSFLIVSLLGVEQVKVRKTFFTDSFTREREIDCGQTVIPLSNPLKAGLSYEFSFSFQPTVVFETKGCICKSSVPSLNHNTAPPSFGGRASALESPAGVSVRYFVYARLGRSNISSCKLITFVPTGLLFELAQPCDEVSGLGRKYEVGSSLKTGLLKRTYHGTLALQAHPTCYLRHKGSNNAIATGSFSFSVTHFPEHGTAPGLPLSASYRIFRIVGAVSNDITADNVSCVGENVSRTVICGDDIDLLQSSWSGNELQVTVNYKAPSVAMEVPSFTSCFSFARYELFIALKHSWGSLKLTVPLVVQATSLPAYSSDT